MKSTQKEEMKLCFVLTPFKEPFNTYYLKIIEPAIKSAGLLAIRGDSLFRPSPIMDDIWKFIQRARVILAELTEKNPNVFYELGLSHSLGKPVILISETIDDVPFDLRSLRVLQYNKDDPDWGDKLRNAIIQSLKETLENPSETVPPMFRKIIESQAPEETEALVRIAKLEAQIEAMHFELQQISEGPYEISNESLELFGVRVRHETYGEGEILSSRGTQPNRIFRIQFKNFGIKRFAEKYANLQWL